MPYFLSLICDAGRQDRILAPIRHIRSALSTACRALGGRFMAKSSPSCLASGRSAVIVDADKTVGDGKN
jgi:hypothetical protein